MKYKNIEIHNIAEIIDGETKEGICWLRVPLGVYNELETMNGKRHSKTCAGVEFRFVMKSESVTFRMRSLYKNGTFHVYRGSIQGSWEDTEEDKVITEEIADYTIKKSENLPILNRMTNDFSQPFSPEVVRVVFDRGVFELIDIIGDVEPPGKEQLPKKTLLAYGSSITYGTNSIDASHSWVSLLAHNLKMDVRNLGMSGSCWLEPKFIDYIASEGENGKWDMVVLELGINVLHWEKEKIIERVENVLRQVAARNPDKPIFIVSPFYGIDDYTKKGKADIWRRLLKEVIERENYSNVTYINGLDILGDMSFISADGVHPNIYGILKIAERLSQIIG